MKCMMQISQQYQEIGCSSLSFTKVDQLLFKVKTISICNIGPVAYLLGIGSIQHFAVSPTPTELE